MGGVGKTVLVARLAQDVAPAFQYTYWRSLRDALPINEWLSGVIGFLSGQQLVAPEGEAARIEPWPPGASAGVPGRVEAPDASLAGAHLAEAVLAEAFNFPSA